MRAHRINIYMFLSVALAMAVFAGCNGSSNSTMPSGMMNLSVSDTPVDGATSVVVSFTGVEIQPAGQGGGDHQGEDDCNEGAPSSGTTVAPPSSTSQPSMGDDDQGDMGDDGGDADCAPSAGTTTAPASSTSTGDMDADDGGNGAKPLTFTFPTPRQIDLIQQQNGASAILLNGVNLAAGNYAWIRLMVAATGNTITLSDGSVHNLTIPSGDETGLKLVHGFTVSPGGTVSFNVDFDLRRSVILANGQYFLKPVLRITNGIDAGGISGTVANTFQIGTTAVTDPACMPAAYVFAGDNVTPVDINPASTVQPVANATVKLDDDTGDYRFRAGFLAPGDYTVALVCAAGDNPATADTLTFSATKTVTVVSDSSVAVTFP